MFQVCYGILPLGSFVFPVAKATRVNHSPCQYNEDFSTPDPRDPEFQIVSLPEFRAPDFEAETLALKK
jgi:hypothetical protein